MILCRAHRKTRQSLIFITFTLSHVHIPNCRVNAATKKYAHVTWNKSTPVPTPQCLSCRRYILENTPPSGQTRASPSVLLHLLHGRHDDDERVAQGDSRRADLPGRSSLDCIPPASHCASRSPAPNMRRFPPIATRHSPYLTLSDHAAAMLCNRAP